MVWYRTSKPLTHLDVRSRRKLTLLVATFWALAM